ncbi:hypothetical protein [Cupriavidus sp. D39]|uniref:hypothetical protein n=1 Tax=Cupriavidus sp. D39 TaxID=2997877 RepID=UPI00226EEA98|nr:hypothetical protein [Cupriavidus sp. D39]MCY0853304.1 hypothetical protein [Cupriavidus sp. D39]
MRGYEANGIGKLLSFVHRDGTGSKQVDWQVRVGGGAFSFGQGAGQELYVLAEYVDLTWVGAGIWVPRRLRPPKSPFGADPMKTMTCRELGGKCDEKLSASSWDEMVNVMTKHVLEKHPDVAKMMEKMHNEDPTKWGKEMRPKWDAAPET